MRPNPRFLVALIVLSGAAASVANAQPWGPAGGGSKAGVRWVSTLPAAAEQARQTKKLVLLHFWSPTCGPCQLLENHVFNQPAVASAIHNQFVPVKVNVDQNPALAQRYKIRAVPTDVVLGPGGEVVQQLVSPKTPMAYVSTLMEAHSKATSYAGREYELAAAAAPFGPDTSEEQTDVDEKPPLNAAYAGLSLPKQTVTPPPTAPVTPQRVDNQYAAAPQPQAPAQVQRASVPSTASLASQLPAGSPPLGLEGYCPVTMKRDRQWVLGDLRWGVRHQGRTYLFASPAARDEFLQNSVVYGPVLSGIDPVIYVETGSQVAGKRQYGTEYDELVFLFASEESLNKFSDAPEQYTQVLQQRLAASRGMPRTR
ncbi:MAG: thioredoxin domain-containing protein [Planctomycetota bacterium]